MASSSDRSERKQRPVESRFSPGAMASYPSIRVLPQSLDTEKALLGSLMLSTSGMYEVADIVRPDSFYADQNRKIFDAMLSLYTKGQPIDLLTVTTKLKDMKILADIGGEADVSELANSAVSPGSAKHYADVVQTKFVLRSLVNAGFHISELGFDESRDVVEIINDAEAAIFSVANAPALRKFSVIKEELGEAWERLESLQKHEASIRGVPTGFPALDNMLSGLQKSDLVILAARPSMGKTALALDIARQTATK